MNYSDLIKALQDSRTENRQLKQIIEWLKAEANIAQEKILEMERKIENSEREIRRLRFMLRKEQEFSEAMEEETAAWRAKAMNDDFYNES